MTKKQRIIAIVSFALAVPIVLLGVSIVRSTAFLRKQTCLKARQQAIEAWS